MRDQLPVVILAALGVGVGLLIWRGVERMRHAHVQEAPHTESKPARVTESPPPKTPTASSDDSVSDAEVARTAQLVAGLDRIDARTDEAVLTFTSAEAYRSFLARAAAAGLTVLARTDGLLAVRIRYDSPYDLQRELLVHARDYADTSANFIMEPPQPPAAEDRATLQLIPVRNELLSLLGVSGNTSSWGRGVTIAIVDSGIVSDATFGMGRVHTLDVGQGVVALDGHGTAVASLAAGALSDAQGVAPAATLLSIRVIASDGVSDIFTVASAIYAAVDAGADIVNLSLGAYQTSAVLSRAIDYATQKGVVLVAAVGNDQANQITWPAADSRVVAVGAVDALSQQATFSNSGSELDLTAPGYAVQAAWVEGKRVYFSGTSAAAPIVAGAIAALVSQTPGMKPAEAVSILEQYASEAGPAGVDIDYGNGVLNLGWALARNDYARVDTAIASHLYDTATGQVSVVVQNRSASPVSGLNLVIDVNGIRSSQSINWIEAGGTATIAVSLAAASNTTFSSDTIVLQTQLLNPAGTFDVIPENNTRITEITLPGS